LSAPAQIAALTVTFTGDHSRDGSEQAWSEALDVIAKQKF
jgi:hypothetical protein